MSEITLPDDFECFREPPLPLNECGATTNKLETSGVTGFVTCGECGANITIDPEEPEELPEEAPDEEEETSPTQEAPLTGTADILASRTPEERQKIRALSAMDYIIGAFRSSDDKKVIFIGDYLYTTRWSIVDLYMQAWTEKHFKDATPTNMRLTIVSFAYARKYDNLVIPPKSAETLGLSRTKVERAVNQFIIFMSGVEDSPIISHMRAYGKILGIKSKTIDDAVSLWEAATPVYVQASDEVRAIVWVCLAREVFDGIKFNKAEVNRKTGKARPALARVEKIYRSYFKNIDND